MPKRRELSRKELDRIVRKEAPGYRIAPEQRAAPDVPTPRYAKPDATVPSLEQTRRKYGDQGPGAHAARRPVPKAPKDEPRSKAVPIEPDTPNADARRIAPKRVLISGKGKITSRQG
jgi:hypothetical protein